MNKTLSRIVIIIEIILTCIFFALLIDTALAYKNNGLYPSFRLTVVIIALSIALVFPLATHIIIRVKHRSNTPEGEILPFLFLSITLECICFLPTYYIETGHLIFDPIFINVLIRFAFLANAILFLFVSLLLMGANNNNYITYLIISLVTSLVLSMMAPNSSSIQAAGSNFGSDYDVYFNFAIALITVATIITFIGAATKDKMRHGIQKSISYILLAMGNYGIFLLSNSITTIIASVILIVGCIMLTVTSKESF